MNADYNSWYHEHSSYFDFVVTELVLHVFIFKKQESSVLYFV